MSLIWPPPSGIEGVKKSAARRMNFQGRKFPQNPLAQCGYWSTPVQNVVGKWRRKIGEHWCQHYVVECCYSVLYGDAIKVNLAMHGHKGFVIELLGAFHRLDAERDKPSIWVLELCNSGSAEYDFAFSKRRPHSIEELRKEIKQRSGKYFSKESLTQCIRRLRLNDSTKPKTDPSLCAEYVRRKHVTEIG